MSGGRKEKTHKRGEKGRMIREKEEKEEIRV